MSTVTIEPHRGGWMVRMPDGDFSGQPSREFALAYARQWFWRRGIVGGKIEWIK